MFKNEDLATVFRHLILRIYTNYVFLAKEKYHYLQEQMQSVMKTCQTKSPQLPG